MLNQTLLVSDDQWLAEKGSMEYFEWQETLHARYGFVVLMVGAGIPVLLKALTYLPYMTSLFDKIQPMLYASTFKRFHVQSLPYYLGNPPTVGQGLYIILFVLLNIFVTCLDYKSLQPNTWFETRYQEIMAYVANRTGVIAFALAPLVILFSSRNNILIWLTNWPHSTFILLHRWVARVFFVQIIVHSFVELALYIDMGSYEEELVQEYWIWGCVATVAMCIMILTSVLWFRQKMYELFLVIHIVMAIFVLAGSWYHVEFLFQRKWGYEMWIYAACAVWFFDRLLRVLKTMKVGLRRAKVVDVGAGFVRVDVEGVRCNGEGLHAYAYFPALVKWRPWENHPFSIIPTAFIHAAAESQTPEESSDIEKVGKSQVVHRSASLYSNTGAPMAGVSLYIRKSAGITQYLNKHDSLLTLLDGPYRNHNHDELLNCDRLVLIGGGIGITAVLPFVRSHLNAKLYWSMKKPAEGLYSDLKHSIDKYENEVRIGERFDLKDLLVKEAEQGWRKIGVIACGPGGMCDDLRAEVVGLGKGGKTVFVLQVEAFSW